MENCLIVCYAPEDTGAPGFMFMIRKYENESQALWAYAETPCYWSQLCQEDDAIYVKEIAEQLLINKCLYADTVIDKEMIAVYSNLIDEYAIEYLENIDL